MGAGVNALARLKTKNRDELVLAAAFFNPI
jgi:hypothetical protein